MKNVFVIFSLLAVILVTGCDSCLIPDDPTNPTQTHETGDTIWMHNMPGSDSLYFDNHLIALGIDGSIYYSTERHVGVNWSLSRIYAVNKEDGTLKWKSKELDRVGLQSNIVVGDDGTIFVIANSLYAIDASTGIIQWTWECPQTLLWDGEEKYTYGGISDLSLTNNGDLVFATSGPGSYHRSLFCVDKTSGNLKWYNLDAMGNGPSSGITIGKDGLLFYYSRFWKSPQDDWPYIVAVEPSTGDIKWKKKINASSSAANNIVIDDNGFLICVISEFGAAGYDLYIRRIDPATGNTLKSSPFTLHALTNFIGPDGYIYQSAWDADGQGYMRINPQLDGKVFFGAQISAINDHNKILCSFNANGPFDPSLGTFNTDGSVDWSVPMGIIRHDILVSDSKVMYGVTNGQIFAIQGEAKLASSGWPRPAHDNRNTNNWNKK